MKGSVKLPVFIDDARKLVNTTQLRAKYLGASYEAEYCQWQTLHGLGSLMETASLIITPNAYLEGKLLASYPPDPIGDFDVTRATAATRVNSAGLVELVPYNLVSYSEQFDNAAYIKVNATITSNAITAPDGTLTADKFESTAAAVSQLIQSITSSNTISIYAKAGNIDILNIWIGSTVTFNLTNGTVTAGTATMEDAGNGWWRCIITTTYNSFNPFIIASASGQFVYVWGAQANDGTIKPYQKTETRLNIPRLDYSNGTCPSILVEPQRTNLLTYSSSFDSVDWIKSNSATVTANQTTAPDGTLTADRLNTANTVSYVFNSTTVSSISNNTYSYSVYAKAGTQSSFILGFGTPIGAWFARYDLSTASVTTTSGASTTAKIEDAGNGWYRCIVTATLPIVVYCETQIGFTPSSGNMFIWGAQVEFGSYATSYIPTTSASVTRNADVISKTGISSLIGQTEGTIFGELYVIPQKNDSMLCLMRDLAGGLYDDFFYIRASLGVPAVSVRQGATTYVAINGTTALSEGFHKFAFAYKQNDFAFYVDGQLIGTDTSGNVPTCNEVYLGNYLDGVDREVSKKSFALWKQRLSNTQLAQLTTI